MMRKPSMKPAITCDPASRVPTSPSENHFQGCAPLRTKYCVTISSLPGGTMALRRCGSSVNASRKAALLLKTPSARSSIGKKRQKHVERYRLAERDAVRKNPAQSAKKKFQYAFHECRRRDYTVCARLSRAISSADLFSRSARPER